MLEILAFAPNTYRQEAYYKWQLVADDSDDNKFGDFAIASNADFLVDNDRHFQPLLQLKFSRVPIVALQAFLAAMT